ncbi:peroxiredoxin, partial [Leucobacter sp. OLJS4]
VERSLADYRGQKVVLFFYPEAMTPACTKEACEFQESSAPLEAAGYRVLGVSRDAVERLRRFADRDSLEYPLLSDPDTAVHRAYGAFGTKNSYGRIIEGVIRSTFVIDADGKIEHALYNIKATGHVARVTKLLGV